MTTRDGTRRVLHITQPTSGGTAAVVKALSAGASDRFAVTVASPALDGFDRWSKSAGVSWIPLELTRQPSLVDLKNILAVRRLLRQFDVVHLHSSKAGAVGRLAAATLRKSSRPRIVFTPHAWSWYVGGRMSRFYRFFESWAQKYANRITVVSQAEYDDGRQVLGPTAALTIIENGVDTDRFTPDGPAAPLGAGYAVVAVGRLSRQKGQDRLIRAFASAKSHDARLILVGDGEDEAELRELCSRSGVADRVDFVGQADPRPYLRAADLVVLPSRWEGMSLVLLEAMACGAAIVSTSCGGSDALGDAGVRVPAGDDRACVSALLLALDELLPDVARRQHLRDAARQRAVECYSLSAVIEAYAKIW